MDREERGIMIAATMELMTKVYGKLDETTKMDLGCLSNTELRDEYEHWKLEVKKML